jgi:4-hydroxybenzoate polyprenyltransferase
MAQSKHQTIKEVLSGTTLGMVGSWLITMGSIALFPNDPIQAATVATAGCTVWSLTRGYAVRRYFNKQEAK